MGRATYSTSNSENIAIGSNLWGLMQACMQMGFFENKEEVDQCFFEVTEAQAEAMLATLKPDAAVANKEVLTSLIAAIKDPDCAELKAELCELLSDDISFSGSGV